MAERAKHAYGSRANLENAIANGAVDAYGVLFLKGEGETPAIGWVDKNGNPVVITPADDLATLEAELETKIAEKASSEEVEALGTELATKITAEEVGALIDEKISEVNYSYEVVEF